MNSNTSNKQFLWNLFCAASIVGIWPRYIEPSILLTTQLQLSIPQLPPALQGLRLLQFSDLHWNESLSDRFLNRFLKNVRDFAPDLIFFTGDFLSRSELQAPDRLKQFLCQLHAPYGCYAVLGNHDYSEHVSVSQQGDYDLIDKRITEVRKGFQRLFSLRSIQPTGKITERVQKVLLHTPLMTLLNETPFKLLHNDTHLLPIGNSALNICGLGEYMLGKCLPQQAFKNYNSQYPGVVLAHNPDSVSLLKGRPGSLILCGHTHGGQVDLPWLRDRFLIMENPKLKKGLHRIDDRWMYVNRGIGGVSRFRCCSPPEILLITLTA